MHAIVISRNGGPEVLDYQEIETPRPGPGEILVKVKAIGVNYIDVYHRIGAYSGKLPFTPGMEAAGEVSEVGPDTREFKPGDKVAYPFHQGSYAEYAIVPEAKLVPVPPALDEQTAAAAMLQGMTAHYLTESTYPIQPGDQVLVHAAAGGAGLLLCQLARRRGAHVIGTVSTEEKAVLARQAGCHDTILYTQVDFESEVKRLTGGQGLAVVYDSVGKDTFEKSLNCLRLRGYMVLFGASSGPVAPLDPQLLNSKGSLFLTRPSLGHYIADRASLLKRAGDVLGWIAAGELKLRAEHIYPLAQAAQAHRDLEARATTGKILLIP